MDRVNLRDLPEHCHREVMRLYVFEGRSREELEEEAKRGISGHKFSLTKNQWTSWLHGKRIYKNINAQEARWIQAERERLALAPEGWNCLVLSEGNIALDVRQAEQYCQTNFQSVTGFSSQHHLQPTRRCLTVIPLPFNLTRLDDPDVFKGFGLMLWYAGQHFNYCFDRAEPVWPKHDNGLYARSEELKSGLRNLSSLHNMIVDALSQLSRGDNIGWTIFGSATALYPDVVRTYHHRQFPDILAILLLIQRTTIPATVPPLEGGVIDYTGTNHGTGGRGTVNANVSSKIESQMVDHLIQWAETVLEEGDPRRCMFLNLKALIPMDHAGDLVVAFDAYCRHLWFSKIKTETEDFKAYYSYNQASFPRADPGKFYDFFQGKSRSEIQTILEQVDKSLGDFSHETFCLWHTAIRYLYRYGQNNADAQLLCEKLTRRIYSSFLQNRTTGWWDTIILRQLNLDASLTFYLLGSIHEAQDLLVEAMDAYKKSVKMRQILIHPGVWDPTLKSALEGLAFVSQRSGRVECANACRQQLAGMRSVLKASQ